MIINGTTTFLTLLGNPIKSVKSPMIYNPYLQSKNLNSLLLPVEVSNESLKSVVEGLFQINNFLGSLVTMPFKIKILECVDELSITAKIAGSCNAIRKNADGKIYGDMFDGEGFVRGVVQKGLNLQDKKALVVGAGGVGRAIAASLAAAGVKHLAIYDTDEKTLNELSQRLQQYYPKLVIEIDHKNPTGFDLVVNATPLGMNEGDLLPIDVSLLESTTFVGDVVMKNDVTPFLKHALDKGCQIQVGTDMLFEQIPAYLEFFGLPTTDSEYLRKVAKIEYL